MVKTQRSAQLTTGILLSVLGVLTVYFSLQIKGIAGTGLHSRTFPVILSWMLVFSAIALVATAIRWVGEDTPVAWPDREGLTRVLVTLASLALLLVIIEPLGMPLGILAFVSFSVWYVGRYRPITALAIGGVTAVSVWFLFNRLLDLPFPLGIFGA
ncbi:MAG: tripartite tricarboxylate transporter TctB family protein [Chloroflexi bacterium]|nr:tripartite tricarboxylate transporter TctB family protein [Chloroflexota bacterium]